MLELLGKVWFGSDGEFNGAPGSEASGRPLKDLVFRNSLDYLRNIVVRLCGYCLIQQGIEKESNYDVLRTSCTYH